MADPLSAGSRKIGKRVFLSGFLFAIGKEDACGEIGKGKAALSINGKRLAAWEAAARGRL